jgi:hypothetical protein
LSWKLKLLIASSVKENLSFHRLSRNISRTKDLTIQNAVVYSPESKKVVKLFGVPNQKNAVQL